jgi:hypothetical protein
VRTGDAGTIGARGASWIGRRRGLEIAAVQRTKPGEIHDHVTPIMSKEKSSGRVRGLPIYLFVRAALVIFTFVMSFVPPGWLKRGGC